MHFTAGLLAALSVASLGGANPVTSRGVAQFQPKPGSFPATGDDTIAGGIFCISLTDLSTYLSKTGNNPGATGTDSPKAGQATSGSGPYPAGSTTDSTLPKHTIFAPKTPPAGNISMPFIAWGNGGCGTDPSTYRNLLTEIASHGYVIAADGLAGGNIGESQTMVTDMRASVDWAAKGGAAKYGNVNASAIITMGHSCGGLEAMSTAYHDTRIGHIFLFDIAIFDDDKRYLLQEIKVPVAWMVGGAKDMGYPNAKKDYALLPTGLPAAFASLDTGHGGTFAATNGGKAAIAAVNYLEWQMRGNATAKAMWLQPTGTNGLTTQGFKEVMTKNWT